MKSNITITHEGKDAWIIHLQDGDYTQQLAVTTEELLDIYRNIPKFVEISKGGKDTVC